MTRQHRSHCPSLAMLGAALGTSQSTALAAAARLGTDYGYNAILSFAPQVVFRPPAALTVTDGMTSPLSGTGRSVRKVILFDAFWRDLGLILDACWGHGAALLVALFVVRFWSGCGVACSSILVPFWITFWSKFGAF